jgi:enoyl-CoA hydratase
VLEKEEQDGIGIWRLNHGKVNALDVELCQELGDAFSSANSSDLRAVVLTGTGRTFSAGVDLFRVVEGGSEYVRIFLPALNRAMEQIFTCRLPVVVGVNGHAIAGGCIIACAGDVKVAASGNGKIGIPELKVGLPFPVVALEIMRSAAPEYLSKLLTEGRTYGMNEARTLGLVDKVVEPNALMDEALAQAKRLGSVPKKSFRLTKEMLRAPAIRNLRSAACIDQEVLSAWSDPEILAAIQDYLIRTLAYGSG